VLAIAVLFEVSSAFLLSAVSSKKRKESTHEGGILNAGLALLLLPPSPSLSDPDADPARARVALVVEAPSFPSILATSSRLSWSGAEESMTERTSARVK
jgi:hypothetical protein